MLCFLTRGSLCAPVPQAAPRRPKCVPSACAQRPPHCPSPQAQGPLGHAPRTQGGLSPSAQPQPDTGLPPWSPALAPTRPHLDSQPRILTASPQLQPTPRPLRRLLLLGRKRPQKASCTERGQVPTSKQSVTVKTGTHWTQPGQKHMKGRNGGLFPMGEGHLASAEHVELEYYSRTRSRCQASSADREVGVTPQSRRAVAPSRRAFPQTTTNMGLGSAEEKPTAPRPVVRVRGTSKGTDCTTCAAQDARRI